MLPVVDHRYQAIQHYIELNCFCHCMTTTTSSSLCIPCFSAERCHLNAQKWKPPGKDTKAIFDASGSASHTVIIMEEEVLAQALLTDWHQHWLYYVVVVVSPVCKKSYKRKECTSKSTQSIIYNVSQCSTSTCYLENLAKNIRHEEM